jgi:molybdopterin molybdotransferase
MDIPPFDKSAMDGYAVRSSDVVQGGKLVQKGSVQAGSDTLPQVGPGECVRIMTGAPVPSGADAVVMVEKTRAKSGGVIIDDQVRPGQNICVKGEDLAAGRTVLKEGTRLNPAMIAVLATAGQTSPEVFSPPSVAVLSTGNELVEPGNTPGYGHIRNCNGPLLTALCREQGIEAAYLGIAPDSPAGLRDMLEKGLAHDVLLISGGVSMGDYDLVPGTLTRLGVKKVFHRVRVKPGKPLFFGTGNGCLAFGIPGNPVSNMTSFYFFVLPALRKMMGDRRGGSRYLARINSGLQRSGSRAWLVPSLCTESRGKLNAEPVRLNGSADIVGCSGANGILIIDQDKVEPGSMVEVVLTGPVQSGLRQTEKQ